MTNQADSAISIDDARLAESKVPALLKGLSGVNGLGIGLESENSKLAVQVYYQKTGDLKEITDRLRGDLVDGRMDGVKVITQKVGRIRLA